MLPRIAIPSAPPSSAPVSEIPEAAPAPSGGADPPTRPGVAADTGAPPRAGARPAAARGRRRRGAPPTPPGGGPPPRDPGGQVRADDEAGARRQRPQARLQR